jgi:hypothetical protein
VHVKHFQNDSLLSSNMSAGSKIEVNVIIDYFSDNCVTSKIVNKPLKTIACFLRKKEQQKKRGGLRRPPPPPHSRPPG